MAKYSNTIEYSISTKLDASGLTQFQAQLQQIELRLQDLSNRKLINESSVAEARTQLQSLSDALTKSFNPSLGMLDLSKFRTELKNSKINVDQLANAFKMGGVQGQTAFNNLVGQIGKFDTGIKRTSSTLDKMFNTIGNTVRWGVVASGFSQMLNALHQSVDYVKELDDSLTQIMLVTDYSRQQMNDYAKSANEAAKALGSTTVDVTQGSLVFAQQGFNLQQSSQLAEYSIKLANASQQDAATTSDQITALMNAYDLSGNMEELSKALDSWALVANISAADVEELAKASQKAASSASTVGVSLDQMNAQIATIESVTRDAPEQIGNGLKTLYSRLSDISLGETLEDGVNLGKVTSTLESIGVKVLDQAGQMRNVGDIMEDLMVVWDNLDQTSKEAAGQAIAGKYQLNRFYALMDNSGMYREYKEGSAGASGTLDQMNEEFVNSLQGRMNKLQATWEDLFNSLFNTDSVYPFIDVATKAIDLIDSAVDSIGGGLPLLTGLVSVFGRLFSNQLSQNISNFIANNNIDKIRAENVKNVQATISELGLLEMAPSRGSEKLVQSVQWGAENQKYWNTEQIAQYNKLIEEQVRLLNEVALAEDQLRKSEDFANVLGAFAGENQAVFTDPETGEKNIIFLLDALETLDQKDLSVAKLSEHFQKVGTSLENIANSGIEEISNLFDNIGTDTQKLQELENELSSFTEKLEDLGETGNITTDELSEFLQKLEAIDSLLEQGLFTEAGDQFKEITSRLSEKGEFLKGLKTSDLTDADVKTAKNVVRDDMTVRNRKLAAEQHQRLFDEGFVKDTDNQKQIKSIIDITAAVGQLAFAWQSFQNLGNIISNDDIGPVEKFTQVLMNLSFAIPSVVTGIKEIKNGVDGIKNWITGVSDLANIKSEVLNTQANLEALAIEKERAAISLQNAEAAKLEAIANKNVAFSTYEKIKANYALAASEADVKFEKATLLALEEKEKAITATLIAQKEALEIAQKNNTVATTLYNFAKKNEETLIGRIIFKNGAAAAAQTIYNASMAKGATAASVLKIALGTLNPAFLAVGAVIGIAGVAIANGLKQAEEYKEAINSIAEKSNETTNALKENFDALENAQSKYNETGEASEEYTSILEKQAEILDIHDAKLDIAAGKYDELKGKIDEATESQLAFNTAILKSKLDNEKGKELGSGLSLQERQAIGISTEKIENKNVYTASGATGFTEQYTQGILERAALMQKYIDDRTNRVADLENQIQRLASNTDIANNKETALQITNLRAEQEKYNQEIARTSAEMEQYSEQIKLAQDILDNQLKSAYENNKKIFEEGTFEEIKQYIQNLQLDGINEENINSLIQKYAELAGNIKIAAEASKEMNVFNPSFGAPDHMYKSQKDNILKEAELDNTDLEGYEQETLQNTESLANAQKILNKEVEKGSEEYNELAKSAGSFVDQTDLDEFLEDITVSSLETYNGLVKISKISEDLFEALDNLSDTNWEDGLQLSPDLYKDYEELKNSLGEILNVNPENISNNFLKDHLTEIKELADGNTDSFHNLQIAMAETLAENDEYDVHIKIADPSTSTGFIESELTLRETLFETINQLQEDLPNLEMGMEVDQGKYQSMIDTFNAAIDAGVITRDGLNQILGEVGAEFYIDYSMEEIPSIVAQASGSLASSIATGMASSGPLGAVMAAIPASIEFANSVGRQIAVPRIRARNSGGSSGPRYAPKSSGGSGGGGKGKGGGGGGGGSGDTYEPKTKDPIEEEIDLYEKVNTQLDDVEETLSGIQQETDRLIGPEGRANMNKQITLLEKEIDLQKEKLAIQEKERNDLRNQLSPFGTEFDSEGFISNYPQVLKSLEGRVNDLINEYNNTATEEGQEALESSIEDAQENLDKFKDLYQRYDELQGKEIKETLNQIEELKDAIEDLRIEAYKASQEAINDLKELRDNAAELLGLFTDYKSDSPFRATIVDAEKLKNIFGGTKKEAIDYYQTLIDKNEEMARKTTDAESRATYQSYAAFFRQQQGAAANNPLGTGALGLASQDLARLQTWIDNPNAADNPFQQNTAALYEAYEDAYNRMRELALESEKAWEQLEEDIIDGYDDIAEREEEQIDRYDRLTDKLETIADVRALVYGEEEFGNISKLYDQIGRTTLQQARDQKLIYEQWVARYQAIEDKTSDIAKQVRTNMEEAEDRLIEIQKEVADAWQKAFENAIKEITAKENQRLFGTRNIDDVSSDWERDRDYADRYYDEVQKANLIEQLRLKYLDLLDDAQGSSLAIQNQIRDAMEEQVKYLQDQEHLSEFNVKYANAQLEILQKQIALEDARNNKNQMRLRRDTQGNYRYVYSANQDDVRDKEADLLQTEFDAYNMSTENRMNTYSDWLSAYQNYIQQREALVQRAEQGDKDAADALKKLEEDFARDMAAYSEELGDSWEGMVGALQWMTETGTDNIRDMAEQAMTAIQEKTDESLGEVGIQWSETIDGVIEDIDTLINVNNQASNDMQNEAQKYRTLIEDEVAPIVTNGFNNIDGAIMEATSSTKDLAAATRELNDALMGDNAQLVEATKQLEEYRKQLDDVKNSSAVTTQQLRKAQEDLDQSKAQNLNYQTILDDIAAGRRDKYGNVPEPPSISGNGDGGSRGGFHVGDIVGFNGWYYYDSWGEDPAGNWYSGQANAVRISDFSGSSVGGYQYTGDYSVHLEDPEDGGWLGWVKPEQLFDTGGYTGDWNGDGRIAMLHQKELVLNSSDTENILNAVNMVRNMADMLKVFSGMSVKGTGFNKLGGDTIKQRVEITAEFPNVQSSGEIEQALLNIADSAYQYSYRTR